jgi:fermentation-respiration switch protein FrsA (DUF1100 family)
MSHMTAILLTIVAAYALLLSILYLFQRHLIYHPEKNIEAPGKYGLNNFSETFTTTSDDVPIQLWHRAAAPGFPTVVYYHGNAGHIGDRAAIFAALAKQGFGVMAGNYRGYGKSGGRPNEQGLYQDARAAIAFATQRGIPRQRIMLYGESLGTGVATQMATEFEVGALILQAPYISVETRAAEIYRFVPVRLLIKDKFATLSKIARVKAPILLFHGEQDVTIPAAHGRSVLQAATSPKEAVFFPNGKHNDFDSQVIAAHVLDFAKKHNLIGE